MITSDSGEITTVRRESDDQRVRWWDYHYSEGNKMIRESDHLIPTHTGNKMISDLRWWDYHCREGNKMIREWSSYSTCDSGNLPISLSDHLRLPLREWESQDDHSLIMVRFPLCTVVISPWSESEMVILLPVATVGISPSETLWWWDSTAWQWESHHLTLWSWDSTVRRESTISLVRLPLCEGNKMIREWDWDSTVAQGNLTIWSESERSYSHCVAQWESPHLRWWDYSHCAKGISPWSLSDHGEITTVWRE